MQVKLSPGQIGTIVADVQFAFEQEVAKWRYEKRAGADLYLVYRAGYAMDASQPIFPDPDEALEVHQHRTYQQATKIITSAGWKAAVKALEESNAKDRKRGPAPRNARRGRGKVNARHLQGSRQVG